MKFIPQITPFDQVTGKLNSYGQNLSFTIFDPKIAYYNASIIAETYSALYGDDKSKFIGELVSFRPSRIIEHEIIIALTTTVKLKDLSDDLMQKFNLIKNSIDNSDLENVHAIALSSAKSYNVTEMNKLNIRSDYKPGTFIPNIIIEEVKNIIIATKIANDYLHESAKTKVGAAINFYVKEGVIETLPVYKASERITFAINGPPASGKSNSEKIIKNHLQKSYNLSWDKIVKINGDSYKYILEPNGYKEHEKHGSANLFSQLIQDEINFIQKMISQRLTDTLYNHGRAPHVFLDKIFIHEENIVQALFDGGKLEGIMMSVTVEKALVRANSRGTETGRDVDTSFILKSHAAIAKTFVEFSKANQNKSISYILLDNNINLTKSAEFNFKDRVVNIYDNSSFIEFLEKAKLNPISSFEAKQIIYDNSSISNELYSQIFTDYKLVDYCLSVFD